MYLLKSQAGARIIAGSLSILPKGGKYINFHSKFPIIKTSFSARPHDISSKIARRVGTWQANLPVARLHIPDHLLLNRANTSIASRIAEGGDFVFDLTGLLTNRNPADLDVLSQASRLIVQLSRLYDQHPWLADEIGVRLQLVNEDEDDAS
jgi:hypothetical protein